MGAHEEAVLWIAPGGVRCVLRSYDDTRLQLRLMRGDGTVMTDLFLRHADAVEAAVEWRQMLDLSRRRESARDPDGVSFGVESDIPVRR